METSEYRFLFTIYFTSYHFLKRDYALNLKLVNHSEFYNYRIYHIHDAGPCINHNYGQSPLTMYLRRHLLDNRRNGFAVFQREGQRNSENHT